MRVTQTLTYLALAACVLAVSGAAARQQPLFRGTGDAVRVFVTVTDGDGRLVTTLARDDFEVRDDGKPQAITLFDSTPQPVSLIVMLDVSGSMEGNLPLLRTAAAQLFARHRPGGGARVGFIVHTESRRAPRGAAQHHSARCAHAALARGRRGTGHVRRRRRRASRDPGAE
jgi:VWFA-related protein